MKILSFLHLDFITLRYTQANDYGRLVRLIVNLNASLADLGICKETSLGTDNLSAFPISSGAFLYKV